PLAGRLHRVSGLLLVLAGGYLTYFWARLQFGSSATIADDPIVGVATRYSARTQTLAGRLGTGFVLALLILLALAAGLWRSTPTRLPWRVGGRSSCPPPASHSPRSRLRSCSAAAAEARTRPQRLRRCGRSDRRPSFRISSIRGATSTSSRSSTTTGGVAR